MRKLSKFLSIILVLVMLVPAIVDASKLTENTPGDVLGEAHIESEVDLKETNVEQSNEELNEEETSKEAEIQKTEEAPEKKTEKTEEIKATEVIKAEENIEKVEANKAKTQEIALLNNSLKLNKDVKRIKGSNRVETAIEVSNAAYPNGTKTVLLAGYDGQADALTATFLAGQIDAPLLLTSKNKLDQNVLDQLKKLKVKNVIILGGQGVVLKDVEDKLKSEKFETSRIEGKNRIETAANIVSDYYKNAGANKNVAEVFVVEYNSLVDALAIGPVSAKKGIPVLLTKKDEVPQEVAQFLKDKNVKKVTIIGGENGISESGKQKLKTYVANVGRIAGKNREETSIKICEEYFKVSDAVVVANGFKYIDALVGGYFAAKNNAPMLLTSTEKVNKETLDCIKNANVKQYVLGGTTVISEQMFDAIKEGVWPPKPAPNPEPVKPEPKPEPKPEEKPVIPAPEEPEEEPETTPQEKPVVPKPTPVPEDKNPIVALDYGHGGYDPGAGYQGRQEKTDTIKLGKLVAADLRRHGVTVDETRKGDEYLSLEDRVKFANKKNYNYFVSFHRNAFMPEKAHGVETWTSKPANIKSTKLAKSIQSNLVGVGFLNRGVKEKNFYVVRWTKAPAVLIELGFIDHTIDNILYDTKQVEIVKAVTSAILGELGIKYKN